MADETVLVYGYDGKWDDCATMRDWDFGNALTDSATYGTSRAYHLHRVPLSLWERWQAARDAYFAVMGEMNDSPRVDMSSVRQAIATATVEPSR